MVNGGGGVFWRVASTGRVWVTLASPSTLKMVFWYPSIGGGSNVSICVTKTPSRYTLAIPMLSLRQPIQLTEVPVKVNVAREPGVLDSEMVPSLQLLFRLP